MCRERVGARLPRVSDIFVDGEAGAVREGGRGPEQRPPDTQPPGRPLRGPGGGLCLVRLLIQADVVTDQATHTGEARHKVTDSLISVQRKLSVREGNPDTGGALLGPLEREGVGEPGILAVPD